MLAQARQMPATIIFIVANVLFFAASSFLDNRSFSSLSKDSFLLEWGANIGALTLSKEHWRLFSNMFLHVNMIHLVANMSALAAIGKPLEKELGSVNFSALYLITGIAGSLASAVANRNDFLISCGASSAIFGMVGAALVLSIAGKRLQELPLKNLLVGIGLTVIAGLAISIDHWAHLGGFVMGVVLTFALHLVRRLSQSFNLAQAGLIWTLGLSSIVGTYIYYYDPDMRQQIDKAELKKSLGHIGLGDSASQYTGLGPVLDCAMEFLESQPAVPDLEVKLRSCENELGHSMKLKHSIISDFQTCRRNLQQMKSVNRNHDEIQAIVILESYCKHHELLYSTIFGKTFAQFNSSAFFASSQALKTISSSYFTNSRDEKLGEALNRVLVDPGDLAIRVVFRNGCPYTSCWRFSFD